MAFYDLSVPADGEPDRAVPLLFRLGCSTVALNHVVTGKPPADVSEITARLGRVREACMAAAPADPGGAKPRILSRVTVELSDPAVAHLLNGTAPGMKEFDLVAVAPTTEKLWAQSCEKLDVDLISLDLSKRLPFFVKPKQVNVALDRGIHLEIAYSGAIADGAARRSLISNAIQMVRASRQRGIVISSSAARAMLVRGPYDVANLARLFGMSPEAAKAAVSINCRAAVSHGAMRRGTSKGVTAVVPMAGLAPGDEWMVPPDLGDREVPMDEEEDVAAAAAPADTMTALPTT